MKRLSYIFILAALAALPAAAEPEITWLNKVYDFGAFDEDASYKTAIFRFVNTGTEDVAIISANATCGCTVPKYTQDPVAPGDTAVIEVAYDPSGRPGRFDKQVYVRTSASNDRTKLVLRGSVIGNAETISARYPVSIGPLKLRNGSAMLGRVFQGHGKMAYVDGYNQSADTIRPVIKDVPPYIEVQAVPEDVAPGDVMTFNFYLKSDSPLPWGALTDSVSIAASPGGEFVSFPIVAIVEEDFSALNPDQRASAPHVQTSAERIILAPVPLHSTKEVTAKIKLKNTGTDPLIIRRVYSQDPGVSVSVSADKITKGHTATLEVKYSPSVQPTGIINARVTVITNDPDNPTLILRVVGERK